MIEERGGVSKVDPTRKTDLRNTTEEKQDNCRHRESRSEFIDKKEVSPKVTEGDEFFSSILVV